MEAVRHNTAREPGAILLRPLVLVALALWILNDHVLKHAVGGWVTGKLSDVVSLVVFPLLPLTAWELWRSRRGPLDPRAGNRLLVGAAVATGFVMATINVDPFAADVYRVGLAAAQWPFRAAAHLLAGEPLGALRRVQLTMDPTDLWTLPALAIPLWVGWRRKEDA